MISIDIRNIPSKYTDEVSFKDCPAIFLAKQTTGCGFKRFFYCPHCYNRRERLYLVNGDWLCRSCIPKSIYRGIQNTTKGGDTYIAYKMERIAASYCIQIEYPFSYNQTLFSRPKGMHNKTWDKAIRQLQVLENMRFQAIFMKSYLEPKVIRHALEHCLYTYSLPELEHYMFDWKSTVNRHRAIK